MSPSLPAGGPECTALTAADQQLIREQEARARAMQESLQAARAEGRAGPLPDARAPYVAHMRLRLGEADDGEEADDGDDGGPGPGKQARKAGKVMDVLLGAGTYVDARRKLRVIDWRSAPLSRLFFAYRAGEDFDEDIGARELSGRLVQQVLVCFDGGRLVRIATPDRALCCRADGAWAVDAQALIPRLGAVPVEAAWSGLGVAGGANASGESGSPLGGSPARPPGDPAARPPVRSIGRPIGRLMAALDREQQAVVADADPTPLLISGSAGTGKTTAALLRLAAWQARDTRQGRGALVIAPERGLARAIQARLEHFDMVGVAVHTFDEWIADQGRRVFRHLPGRVCTEPPPAVTALKRHPALLAILPRFVDALGQDMAARIDHALLLRGRGMACYRDGQAAFDHATGPALGHATGPASGRASLLDRLVWFADALVARGLAERHALDAIVARERERLYDLNADRLALIGDRVWLEAAASEAAAAANTAMAAGSGTEAAAAKAAAVEPAAAGDTITSHMVDATLAHTRVQLSATAEKIYAHVDQDRLRTLDARAMDEGTSSEHADTIDVEDFALMFALLRHKTGTMATPRGRLKQYRHLIIDEAQELAAVELAVLAAARAGDGDGAGVLSLAGDAAQQMSESAGFSGWDAALARAGLDHVRQVHLHHGHRCPRPIALLAHQVLGPLAPDTQPDEVARVQVAPAHAPVPISVLANAAHLSFCLARALMTLANQAPGARVAVIARKHDSARQLHDVLAPVLDVRLVSNGAFLFEPGIDITDVSQVKGLEFDVVIVPDASASAYPDTPHARRLLHVAMTRAVQSLWVMAVGTLSPLIPAAARIS